MAQQGLRSIAPEDEAPGAAVQLGGEQQANHGWLDVLLVILVRVEWLSELLWARPVEAGCLALADEP